MVLNIISVGNKLTPWESQGIAYYQKQLSKNISLNFIDIKGQQHPKRSIDEIKKLESELILSKISDDDYIISWDSRGKRINSNEFSKFFENSMLENLRLNFIIGGSFGLPEKIIEISDKVFSASSFTFPHRLFRIILVEQIYRSFSIINKAPYHK
jgi:23S rRNA (pseudouridine1915-N3)-methyltransferase